jgi:CHAT domain-containing protein/Tfp pilus assembly protein PilF
VEALEQGKPIERELSAEQSHTYQIMLAEGDYLSVKVEQRGIDVVVKVLGPDGKQVLEGDTDTRKHGEERASLVAEVAGAYRLSVQSAQRVTPAGRYEIGVTELRAATERERRLQEARKLGAESLKLYNAGKYDEALSLAERAVEIHRNELGPEHLDVAQSLRVLAIIHRDKGNYERAEPLFRRALDINEKTLGPEHLNVATTLNALAVLHSKRGEYTRAEPLFERTRIIREKALGPEHPEVAGTLNNLAIIYFRRGDYPKAEQFCQRALAIKEKTLGPEHPGVASSLFNLADIYRKKGEYTKAEPLYQRALAIGEKTVGSQHPDVAVYLSGIANLHYDRGEYAKAAMRFQNALAIWEKAIGPEHPNVAYSLSMLALLYGDKGDYEKAEPLYRRALAIWEKSLAPEHPEVANTLNNLAFLYTARGDIAHAVEFQSRASAITERNLALNLVTGSERQKLTYLAILSEQTDSAISLHVRYTHDDPKARGLAATLILQRKGRALDATSQNLNALRRRFSTEDQALLDQLTDTRSQLARLILGGPQRMTAKQYREQIKALESQAETFEADIGRKSSEFRAQSLPVTLAAVRTAIPPDAALIEFAVYRPFNVRATNDAEAYGQSRYVTYVLRREGEIKWQELGDAKTIDDAVAAFRTALSDPKRRDVKRLARAVDEKVMQPLRPLLGDAKQILVSPDGDLNLIPFEALVDEQGQYLIERYAFTYLTSGRDLLRLQVERESKSDPLVIADPMFGQRDQLARADVSRRRPARMRLRRSVTTGPELSSIYFAPLLGTELEAREIKSLFPEARVLVGEEATEASLKRTVAPRILHIATHGFFLEDRPVRIGGARGLSSMRDDGVLGGSIANVKIENPLLRSGLALAGANRRTGSDDDGILTALEASGLNLWGTQLVVLSACDTGVGVVRTRDGVNGLRRALVLAGSETQVMSLWPVRDYVTQRLMKAFYTGLKQGQGRGEALRNVKLMTMRRRGTEHPFYWAGFIQSGKWTELDDR